MHKDRSRYRNIVLLLFAAYSVLIFIFSFWGEGSNTAFLVMMLVVFLLFLILPFFLIANGFVMMRREGKSLANLLSLLFGVVLLAGELAAFFWGFGLFLGPEIGLEGLTGIVSALSPVLILLAVTTFYLSITFMAFVFYCVFLQLIPIKRDFDYVIIHGAGLRKEGTVTKLLAERCDKAIAIYHRDPTPPYLIPSGGQGRDEVRSEAEAMKEYLLDKGIPEEKIMLEDKSATTMENIVNSKNIIQAQEGRKYTALVTSNYHVYRAMRYARKAGLKAVGIGAHVAFYYWPSAVIREFAAVHKEKKHLILYLIGYLLIILPFILMMVM